MRGLFYLFGVGYALASFVSTRGPDGGLFSGLVLHAFIAIIYVIALIVARSRFRLGDVLAHTVVFEICVILPFVIPPVLQEMAGMLYLILPVFPVAAGVVGLAIFSMHHLSKENGDFSAL